MFDPQKFYKQNWQTLWFCHFQAIQSTFCFFSLKKILKNRHSDNPFWKESNLRREKITPLIEATTFCLQCPWGGGRGGGGGGGLTFSRFYKKLALSLQSTVCQKRLKSTIFSQICLENLQFWSKISEIHSTNLHFLWNKTVIIQLKSNQIYNLWLRAPPPAKAQRALGPILCLSFRVYFKMTHFTPHYPIVWA